MSIVNHSPEEILIAPTTEFWPERQLACSKNSPLQEHVSGAPFRPVENSARWMDRSFVEFALFDPPRWPLVEMPLYGAKHAVDVMRVAGFKQSEQPVLSGKFVVVDEGDETPAGVLDGHIPRQCDILLAFHAILNGNSGPSREL
jgi:hypothetical protein